MRYKSVNRDTIDFILDSSFNEIKRQLSGFEKEEDIESKDMCRQYALIAAQDIILELDEYFREEGQYEIKIEKKPNLEESE